MKVIEAIYENGVLKPLGKLDLKEGEKVKIEIKSRSIEEFIKALDELPEKKIDLKKIEGFYYEAKMLD